MGMTYAPPRDGATATENHARSLLESWISQQCHQTGGDCVVSFMVLSPFFSFVFYFEMKRKRCAPVAVVSRVRGSNGGGGVARVLLVFPLMIWNFLRVVIRG